MIMISGAENLIFFKKSEIFGKPKLGYLEGNFNLNKWPTNNTQLHDYINKASERKILKMKFPKKI